MAEQLRDLLQQAKEDKEKADRCVFYLIATCLKKKTIQIILNKNAKI